MPSGSLPSDVMEKRWKKWNLEDRVVYKLPWKVLDLLWDEINPNSGIKILFVKHKGSYVAVALNSNISEKNVFVIYFQSRLISTIHLWSFSVALKTYAFLLEKSEHNLHHWNYDCMFTEKDGRRYRDLASRKDLLSWLQGMQWPTASICHSHQSEPLSLPSQEALIQLMHLWNSG